jgi:protein-tyrosine phosphatase
MTNTTLHVATICTGNICRSPMAEIVLRHLVAADPILDGHVDVTSAGTALWHVDSPMDPRARAALDRAGYDLPGTLGAFANGTYLDRQDLVLVMTREHLHDVQDRLSSTTTEVILWRNLLEPEKNLDVADPYYGDDNEFDACLAILSSAGQRLTSVLRSRLDEHSHEV